MTVPGADVGQLSRIAELEREIEALEEAVCDLEVYLLDGYFVTLYHDPVGQYVASCPTLHTDVAEATAEEALAAVKLAVVEVQEAEAEAGLPIPPRDVETRCLDCPQ